MEKYNWISIEDMKPEIGSSVLTYPHFRVLPFGNTCEEKESNWSDNDFWQWSKEGNCAVKVNPYPTHWLPLPPAPNS